MKIYKYHLPLASPTFIEMPQDAQILSCQEQDGDIKIWALVNQFRPNETRAFFVFFTGADLTQWDYNFKFIATVQLGDLVCHIFERFKK